MHGKDGAQQGDECCHANHAAQLVNRQALADAQQNAETDQSQSNQQQKKIAAEIQKEAYDQVIYIPLGQYTQASAWRKSLTGVLDGPATPIFTSAWA